MDVCATISPSYDCYTLAFDFPWAAGDRGVDSLVRFKAADLKKWAKDISLNPGHAHVLHQRAGRRTQRKADLKVRLYECLLPADYGMRDDA